MAFLDLSHPYAILGFSVAFYFILRTSLSLLGNIRYARSTGLNYIIYPFGKNFAELIIAAGCGLRLVQHLPKEWADYWYNTSYASHWAVQGRMARKYGGVYLAVSPAGVLCYVSDATAIAGILASREMFPKAVKSYSMCRILRFRADSDIS